MKRITMFVQPDCPFCKRALQIIDELKMKNSEYANIEVRVIDEIKHFMLAEKFAYYYVPAFYVGDKKVHEGSVTPEIMEDILKKSI